MIKESIDQLEEMHPLQEKALIGFLKEFFNQIQKNKCTALGINIIECSGKITLRVEINTVEIINSIIYNMSMFVQRIYSLGGTIDYEQTEKNHWKINICIPQSVRV
jgi:hypothetical protein